MIRRAIQGAGVLSRVRPWLLDGPYVVQLFLALLSFGWAAVLCQSYCLTCLPTYEGLRVYGGDDVWANRLLCLGVLGMTGAIWPRTWLRVATLMIGSIAWGLITLLFLCSPTPPTGLAIYPDVVLLTWWALWRLGVRVP